MDTTERAEGNYWTAEVVKAMPTKIGVVIDEAIDRDTDFGKVFCCQVEIAGKVKFWKPNRASIKNMHQIDTDSRKWIGKKVLFVISSDKGRDRLIVSPIIEQ